LLGPPGGFFPSPWFHCGACNFEGSVACLCEFFYCSVQLLWTPSVRRSRSAADTALLWCRFICGRLIDIYSCYPTVTSASSVWLRFTSLIAGPSARISRPTRCLQLLSKHLLGWVAGRDASGVGVALVHLDVGRTEPEAQHSSSSLDRSN